MHGALRVAVLAALLGSASAQICCMAMPQCPVGFVSTHDKCQDGESTEECLTVHMCCKTVHCRAVPDFCAKQGPTCGDGLEKCKSGYTCTADPTCTTGDCKQCCVRDETKPPAPTPAPTKCTPYTPPGICIAQHGWCWDHGKCQCVQSLATPCTKNPCDTQKCDPGYVCEPSYCGGCNHRCVIDETKPPAPTPVPVVEPKGCRLGCGSFVPVGWRGADEGKNACNTCSCEADKALVCTEIACLGTSGCPCTLSCGTVVKDQWSGKDEGSNACNTCQCMNGGLACTKRACLDMPCDTKPPAPTPAPKCDDATEPVECLNQNECYNVKECKCGRYPMPRCSENPCNLVDCEPGYVCEDSYCGGCHARCVATKTKPPAPTPVPEPLSFCALQGPTCGRFSPRCKPGYACLSDPTCDRATDNCDRCCCRMPQCKPGFRLRRRRSECKGRSAERGLCYEVQNNCGSFICQIIRRWN